MIRVISALTVLWVLSFKAVEAQGRGRVDFGLIIRTQFTEPSRTANGVELGYTVASGNARWGVSYDRSSVPVLCLDAACAPLRRSTILATVGLSVRKLPDATLRVQGSGGYTQEGARPDKSQSAIIGLSARGEIRWRWLMASVTPYSHYLPSVAEDSGLKFGIGAGISIAFRR
jgi:hypothetical protein